MDGAQTRCATSSPAFYSLDLLEEVNVVNAKRVVRILLSEDGWTAVALIETYLRVNGYFTVTEYPIIETAQRGGYRTVTDLDILAVRFPGAGIVVPKASAVSKSKWTVLPPDPLLGAVAGRTDMIIGEVKEGLPEVNSAVRNPLVLRTALARFGCCSPTQALSLRDEFFKGDTL